MPTLTIDLTINIPILLTLVCMTCSVVYAAGRITQQVKHISVELLALEKILKAHEKRLDDHQTWISNIDGRCQGMHNAISHHSAQ